MLQASWEAIISRGEQTQVTKIVVVHTVLRAAMSFKQAQVKLLAGEFVCHVSVLDWGARGHICTKAVLTACLVHLLAQVKGL